MKIIALSLIALSSLASLANAGIDPYLGPSFQEYLYEQGVLDELDAIRQEQEQMRYSYQIDRNIEEMEQQQRSWRQSLRDQGYFIPE
jgi:Spy/CpxP family protein refolding chaperone